MYVVPYEADFECPRGHRFVAPVPLTKSDATAPCPECYREWVAANVPRGQQVSAARESLTQPATFSAHSTEEG